MDPISNVDRLAMLLRQKLVERSKKGSATRSGDRAATRTVSPSEPSGLEALAASAEVDERVLRRAMVHSILADQFGPALINTAEFQNVVTRVTDAIEQEPVSSRLLSAAIADMRRS